ncbi:unnamed protein product [Gordionus sp. m RMFG-2023]
MDAEHDLEKEKVLILSKATNTANIIRQKMETKGFKYQLRYGIICGSGLHHLSDIIQNSIAIPYSDIPDLPLSQVEGHCNFITIGDIENQKVICFQGRYHFYEGHPLWKVIMPVRIMKLLGVETIFITNLSGGVNPSFKSGDIMVIKDHINTTGNNPLIGINDPNWGTRFPDLNNAYDKDLRHLCGSIFEKLNLKSCHQEGVYYMLTGPSYETKAESKMIYRVGGDAVGMSTIPEVIAARHCGIKVCAMSLIATTIDFENYEDFEKDNISHEFVLHVANTRGKDMANIIKNVILSIQ